MIILTKLFASKGLLKRIRVTSAAISEDKRKNSNKISNFCDNGNLIEPGHTNKQWSSLQDFYSQEQRQSVLNQFFFLACGSQNVLTPYKTRGNANKKTQR